MHKQSLFLRMVIFGCILSILPVVIVGGFSYLQSSKEVQKQVHQGKMQYMKQMNSNIEQILITNNHTLVNLLESSFIATVLDSPLTEYDFKLHSNLIAEMTRLQTFELKVSDVIILNISNNWLVKNTGKYQLDQYPEHEQLLIYMDQPKNSWILTPQYIFMGEELDTMGEDLMNNCPYNISMVKQLPIRSSQKKGLAFVNIPVCSIVKMIKSDEVSEEIIIVNENQEIMVHQDLTMIGKPLMDTGYVNKFSDFSEGTGQFNTTRDGNPYTVTYHKSNYNNWIYISATSIEALTQESEKIGWLTLYLCLTIISISTIYIWFMSRRIYSPVHKLVNFIKEAEPDYEENKKNELQMINDQFRKLFSSNHRLEHELSQHSQQMRSLFLSRLYSGQLKNVEIDEKLKHFGLDTMIQKWNKITLFSVQIDTFDNTRYQKTDYELLSFAVTNIIEETVSREKMLPSIWIDQTLVFLVGSIHEDSKQLYNDIYTLTEEIQKNINDYLNLSASIGVSLPFDDLKSAPRGYQEGIEALKHRITLGKGVIIHFNSINSGKHSIVYHYPNDIESDLLDSIRIGDHDKSIENLKSWMNKAFPADQSIREYQISMIRLLNQLLIIKQENGISYEQINVHQESLFEELLSLQMSDEIEVWFKNRLIAPLVHVFLSRRDSEYHNISEQIIHLIHEQYDKDITLEDCASKLHYNANYLSSVFKKETHYTFSEYLAAYRLKIAKQWLTENEMTITQIAENLQYNNPQNFIRSFRKVEGMTPGQYRTKYSK